jgi:NADH-quinone oxidoreductase subunit H
MGWSRLPHTANLSQELARTFGNGLDTGMVCKWVPTLVLGLAMASCSDYGPDHDLIKLSGLRPKLVESGDTLQIFGSGFAEGSPARVSFRGDIFRPGEAPKRDVEIVVRTKDTSKDTIAFTVNDELEQAFCGTGPDALHAAFQGTVTLAFAAGSGSLAPVAGTLRGVNLEIVPKVKSLQAAREREQLSRDALKFLGLDLTDEGATDCCTVGDAQGRALLAGIKPGERLVQFEGVPVRAPTDLIPSGRNKMATVWVRRDDASQPVARTIDVQGFRWSIPSELAAAFAALLFAIGLVVGVSSPIRNVFGSLCTQAARVLFVARLRARTHGARLSALRTCLADLPLPDFAALRIAQVFAVIVLGGLCATLTVREELVSGELDLLLWWLLSSATVCVATLIEHLARAKDGWLRSLLIAAQVLAHQLPLLVVIVLVMVASHSPRIPEIVRMQGPWPNSWLIVHDPALTAASLLAIGALVPVAERGSRAGSATPMTQSQLSAQGAQDAAGPGLLRFLSVRVHVWVQSVLLVILLFGGWAVTSDHSHDQRGVWFLLPALVLLAKTWIVIACISFARSVFHSITYRYSTPWVLKIAFPATLLCGVLSCLWTWGVRQWALTWADRSLRWVMLTALVAALFSFVLRTQRNIRSGLRTPLERYWT